MVRAGLVPGTSGSHSLLESFFVSFRFLIHTRLTAACRLFPSSPFRLCGWRLNCCWLILCGSRFCWLFVAFTRFSLFFLWCFASILHFSWYNIWAAFPYVSKYECDVLLGVCQQGHQCNLFCTEGFFLHHCCFSPHLKKYN